MTNHGEFFHPQKKKMEEGLEERMEEKLIDGIRREKEAKEEPEKETEQKRFPLLPDPPERPAPP